MCVGIKQGKEGSLHYVNFKSPDRGSRPLKLACSSENYHAVKTLIQYGADSKPEDMEACSPLFSDNLDDLGDSNMYVE